ncbi:MAG: type I-G CRISPR-associated RAMP protein Csb1/Cas7g [Pyrinomonadaceae bacterium]
MFEQLNNVPRLLMQVQLRPIQTGRIQPTGFADLGAAVYEQPDEESPNGMKRMLLVESAQSVANRLERTCLDGEGSRIAKELEGLPYIVAKLTGQIETTTSSLVEAHRMNSPFIISNDEFKKNFSTKANYAKGLPLDWRKIAAAILFYDPNSLLHGLFMANLEDGRVRTPRMITGFIEAEDIQEAASGGVKNNPFDPSGKIRAANYDKDVYGNVPYARMEYTARRITAYFNFDLALLQGYQLPNDARDLLIALGLYKMRRFLNSGLRLRTACDLAPVGDIIVQAPTDFVIPDEADLLKQVQEKIRLCTEQKLFASPAVTELDTTVVLKKDEKDKGSKNATPNDDDTGQAAGIATLDDDEEEVG